jgi:hypothetical protein
MYVRVYSPEGEPFDVTREKADQLILNGGWTQTPPVIVTEPAVERAVREVPRKKRRTRVKD